ncbi:MAG: hypothetical protein R3D34_11850 [Nitratireductor sp.]
MWGKKLFLALCLSLNSACAYSFPTTLEFEKIDSVPNSILNILNIDNLNGEYYRLYSKYLNIDIYFFKDMDRKNSLDKITIFCGSAEEKNICFESLGNYDSITYEPTLHYNKNRKHYKVFRVVGEFVTLYFLSIDDRLILVKVGGVE